MTREKKERKPYIPKEWKEMVDNEEFFRIIKKHVPSLVFSNLPSGTWTTIGKETLLEHGTDDGEQPGWKKNIGYTAKLYAQEIFDFEDIEFKEKNRRAFKKSGGERLFDSFPVQDIVEEMKEKTSIYLGEKTIWDNPNCQIDCRCLDLPGLLKEQIEEMIERKIIRQNLPAGEYDLGYVDWGDGTTASSKRILLLTGGFLHDPEIFESDTFSRTVATKRTPILLMEAAENKENVNLSQQLLGQQYSKLREPLWVSIGEKNFTFHVKPIGGKSDHHFAWNKVGQFFSLHGNLNLMGNFS